MAGLVEIDEAKGLPVSRRRIDVCDGVPGIGHVPGQELPSHDQRATRVALDCGRLPRLSVDPQVDGAVGVDGAP